MLTAKDKELLNLIQGNLPIKSRPYKYLGECLDLTEEEVISSLKRLKSLGYLRRIGPFFASDKLGYSGVLIALRVKEDNLEQVANIINGYSAITHNYQRQCSYNLWFTLITNSENRKKEILDTIRNLDGVEDILDLPSTKKFKINVQFKL